MSGRVKPFWLRAHSIVSRDSSAVQMQVGNLDPIVLTSQRGHHNPGRLSGSHLGGYCRLTHRMGTRGHASSSIARRLQQSSHTELNWTECSLSEPAFDNWDCTRAFYNTVIVHLNFQMRGVTDLWMTDTHTGTRRAHRSRSWMRQALLVCPRALPRGPPFLSAGVTSPPLPLGSGPSPWTWSTRATASPRRPPETPPAPSNWQTCSKQVSIS